MPLCRAMRCRPSLEPPSPHHTLETMLYPAQYAHRLHQTYEEAGWPKYSKKLQNETTNNDLYWSPIPTNLHKNTKFPLQFPTSTFSIVILISANSHKWSFKIISFWKTFVAFCTDNKYLQMIAEWSSPLLFQWKMIIARPTDEWATHCWPTTIIFGCNQPLCGIIKWAQVL